MKAALTGCNWLVNDALLATDTPEFSDCGARRAGNAFALFASFYLRFEGDAFYDRLPLLLRILPFFVALSVVVCYSVQSDHHEMALYFAARMR